jgi:hypothetical protein
MAAEISIPRLILFWLCYDTKSEKFKGGARLRKLQLTAQGFPPTTVKTAVGYLSFISTVNVTLEQNSQMQIVHFFLPMVTDLPLLSRLCGISCCTPLSRRGSTPFTSLRGRLPSSTGSRSCGCTSKGSSSSSRNFPVGALDEASLNSGSTELIDTLGLLKSLLVLLSLRITVEVQIDHDIPLSFPGSNGATETEDLTSQHPPDQTNSMATLVVCWDSNIDELRWGVGIAESNDRNVDVGSLLDSLSVGAGISDDDEAGFLEGSSDVVGEVTGGETTSDGDGTGVCGEL